MAHSRTTHQPRATGTPEPAPPHKAVILTAFPLASCATQTPQRRGRLTDTFEIEHGATQPQPDALTRLDSAHRDRTRWILKRLKPELAARPATLDRWFQRARANSLLVHPGLARMLSCGKHAEQAYFVQEELPGVALHALLEATAEADASSPAMPLGAAVHVARSILQALAHAYDQPEPLCHLDLDPWSVRIRPDGSVALTELGMWAALSEDDAARQRFDAGRLAYCAPELVRASAGDTRSDLFSLGALLYELLGGSPAFAAESPLGVTLALTRAELPPLLERVPALQPALATWVHTLLAPDPEARFADPREALSKLDALTKPDRRAPEALARLVRSVADPDSARRSVTLSSRDSAPSQSQLATVVIPRPGWLARPARRPAKPAAERDHALADQPPEASIFASRSGAQRRRPSPHHAVASPIAKIVLLGLALILSGFVLGRWMQ